MPKVSVIIPNYNHAKYLDQRIYSVLNQSFQDFEVIILDDCSNDDSRQKIEQFREHPQVSHLIFNDQNSGSTFIQWEKGINLAAGKYIWIAESDDWCEPTLLEELVRGLEKENCSVSYCQSYCVDNDNKIRWISQHGYLSELLEGDLFIKRFMLNNNAVFNASMVLWKKELYPKVSREFLKYKFCGDWLFWIGLARLGSVHISGRLLNYFRKHEDDVSGSASKNGLEIRETLQLMAYLNQEALISPIDNRRALKRLFKRYWKLKPGLEPVQTAAINTLFKQGVASPFTYYGFIISGIWRKLSGG